MSANRMRLASRSLLTIVLYKSITSKKFSLILILFLKILNCIARQLGLQQVSPSMASDRNRENAYYERYCFIQVTCNMDTKGQTWNDII